MKVLVSHGAANNPDAMSDLREKYPDAEVVVIGDSFKKLFWDLEPHVPNSQEYFEEGLRAIEASLDPAGVSPDSADAFFYTEEEAYGPDNDYFGMVADRVLAPVLNRMSKPSYEERFWSDKHQDWLPA